MTPGPRIYNLFPLLAGPIAEWQGHLSRMARMGFDWVYVNPFHYPGFSGSLYAIKDPERLHPVVQGESGEAPDTLIRGFVTAAGRAGVSVMLDLVINHTAKDALLVDRHPGWFRREADGTLRSPRATDPLDPRRYTVWGDLAEIDYDNPRSRKAQIAHWQAQIARYLGLGVRGFRCDAAYQVPAEIWSALIAAARREKPDCVFAAETLGCTPEQVTALAGCGFDYFFNSAKWWDFEGDWLLGQYALYRDVAPTIAFPESHDTERLAADPPDDDAALLARRARFRYLFCCAFSTGVAIPMGFEFGCSRRLNVVDTRPADWTWETGSPRYDLTGFIAEANRLKLDHPVLSTEGPQRRLSARGAPVVALLRTDGGDIRSATSAAITILNPDPGRTVGLDPMCLFAQGGGQFDRIRDVTPGGKPTQFEPGTPLTLGPEEARIFVCDRPRLHGTRGRPPSRAQSARKLRILAERRIAIEAVYPEIDGGRFPAKRVVGDVLDVWADVFGDGHEKIAACIRYRGPGERAWREAPMSHVDNDRWNGHVPLTRIGRYEYTILAWRDLFGTWRADLAKKLDAGLDIALEIREGRDLIEQTLHNAGRDEDDALREALRQSGSKAAHGDAAAAMLAPPVHAAMARSADRANPSFYEHVLALTVDRPAARFSAWYEIFPRSASGDPSRHGTFDDVIRWLPDIRGMGFDVLYLTPIHPIGRTNRKGRNNSLVAGANDPGSPYAIGAAEGGHDATHPELGTLEDFQRLNEAAHEHGLEIALDFAIQCSPDHPWLKEHPDWFDWRADGTVKYAENPPKKYEDIVNLHFYRDALPGVWFALRDIVLFWVDRGVRIFRVDNPHTKPFPFWEWMIAEVQAIHPDVVFLSEAFTRPKVMNRLAKLGFTQSYTYFTWRNTKAELTDYLTELTQGEAKEYFRPNFFTNTPDINPEILQGSDPAAYKMRLVLAATLASSYGIYNGFELCEGRPIPGREEYLDSEKYQIRAWDRDRPGNIRDYITLINRIRRENPALHDHLNLRFQNAWNDHVLVYARMTADRDNAILVAVNLDHHNSQEAHFEVPLWEMGLPDDATVAVEDLFSGASYDWHGKVQRVWLDPEENPCAIWRLLPPRLRR